MKYKPAGNELTSIVVFGWAIGYVLNRCPVKVLIVRIAFLMVKD
jgi:hypothetical protein